jgi:hypothetical protein
MADMRDSAVTMLYVMKDKMQTASRELATINRRLTTPAVREKTSHGSRTFLACSRGLKRQAFEIRR